MCAWVHAPQCVRRSEDNAMELVLSFHCYMGSGGWIQLVRQAQQAPLPAWPSKPAPSCLSFACFQRSWSQAPTEKPRWLCSCGGDTDSEGREKLWLGTMRFSSLPCQSQDPRETVHYKATYRNRLESYMLIGSVDPREICFQNGKTKVLRKGEQFTLLPWCFFK